MMPPPPSRPPVVTCAFPAFRGRARWGLLALGRGEYERAVREYERVLLPTLGLFLSRTSWRVRWRRTCLPAPGRRRAVARRLCHASEDEPLGVGVRPRRAPRDVARR